MPRNVRYHHYITIKANWTDKTVNASIIATIFHEFAHAAQVEYTMIDWKTGEPKAHPGITQEQHAELLANSVMMRHGFWWETNHVAFAHFINARPGEYLQRKEMFKVYFGDRTYYSELRNSIDAKLFNV